MQKLLNYICKELDDLEKRTESGSLSMQDIEYGDALAHFKKNLLTGDAMMKSHSNKGSYDDYSYNDGSYDDYSYDDYSYDDGYRGSRDGMARMSRRMSRTDAKESLIDHLRGIERSSNDEEVKHMIKSWIRQAEK